jgi:hypothetical protein
MGCHVETGDGGGGAGLAAAAQGQRQRNPMRARKSGVWLAQARVPEREGDAGKISHGRGAWGPRVWTRRPRKTVGNDRYEVKLFSVSHYFFQNKIGIHR